MLYNDHGVDYEIATSFVLLELKQGGRRDDSCLRRP